MAPAHGIWVQGVKAIRRSWQNGSHPPCGLPRSVSTCLRTFFNGAVARIKVRGRKQPNCGHWLLRPHHVVSSGSALGTSISWHIEVAGPDVCATLSGDVFVNDVVFCIPRSVERLAEDRRHPHGFIAACPVRPSPLTGIDYQAHPDEVSSRPRVSAFVGLRAPLFPLFRCVVSVRRHEAPNLEGNGFYDLIERDGFGRWIQSKPKNFLEKKYTASRPLSFQSLMAKTAPPIQGCDRLARPGEVTGAMRDEHPGGSSSSTSKVQVSAGYVTSASPIHTSERSIPRWLRLGWCPVDPT